jgi:two-component system, NarL family, sensor kinase
LSSTTQVKILLRQDGGILLQVEDDGIGFKAQATMLQPRDGVGLTSMRERVQMLGGDFAIHSEPGLTVLKAYLPRTSFAV